MEDADVRQMYQQLKTNYPSFQFDLKQEQIDCLRSLLLGDHVFALLPTGYGKSLIYTIFPLLMEQLSGGKRRTALVITPMNSLIRDQLHTLQNHGIKAGWLQKESYAAIEKGDFQILIATPEAVMMPGSIRLLTSAPLKEQLCLLCFDEAHCISEWGLDFRPAYRKVSELVSIVTVPSVTMSATATKEVYDDLKATLAIPDSHTLISKPPDRPNIFIDIERVVENIPDCLSWLVEHIKKHSDSSKKVIIYCRNVKSCENIFMFLLEELGSNAYQRSMKSANTRLIEMYHSRTDKGSVDRIMKGFVNSGGKIRVLVATVAFGMGIDLPDVDVIIHWGVEGTALSYWQELGRCARDGRKGIGILYLYSRSLFLCSDDKMKALCESTGCYRVKILDLFRMSGKSITTEKDRCDNLCSECVCALCTCCSICLKECNCTGKCDNILKRHGLT